MDKEEEQERVAAMTLDLAKVSKEPTGDEDEEENVQDEELMADGVSWLWIIDVIYLCPPFCFSKVDVNP